MNHIKQQAIDMRYEGWSRSDISEKLSVPKSTLSGWLRDMPYIPNTSVQDRVRRGQGAYGLRRH